MLVRVKELCGIGDIPTCPKNAKRWAIRAGIAISQVASSGGPASIVHVSDLPEQERRAYLAKCAAATGLPPGEYDDAAHEAFWQAPASMRAEAERKAAIACLLVSIRDRASWRDRLALVHRRFGEKGTSKPWLKRLLRPSMVLTRSILLRLCWQGTRASALQSRLKTSRSLCS